jgi:hypothetical protein
MNLLPRDCFGEASSNPQRISEIASGERVGDVRRRLRGLRSMEKGLVCCCSSVSGRRLVMTSIIVPLHASRTIGCAKQ